MSDSSGQNRSSMANAMGWVSQITSISLEMALPAGLGYWLDLQWSTKPWLMIVGAVLGFVAAMSHLFRLVQQLGNKTDSKNRESRRRSSG